MGELQTESLTSSPPDQRELEEAASALGIETEYWDIWRREHHASVPELTAILESLGVDAGHRRVARTRRREKRERQTWQ